MKQYFLYSALIMALIPTTAYSQTDEIKKDITITQPIKLQKVDNFRDIAGDKDPYLTSQGKPLQKGIFYRSNALLITEDELAQIEPLNITYIYDLRTPGEIALHPDSDISGAIWKNYNLLGWEDIDQVRTGFTVRPENTLAGAEEIYLNFVENPITRNVIGQLLTDMANNEGTQVFHCSGGKDRTGWVTAILQMIADVPQETIIEDFMLSNKYSHESIVQSFTKMANTKGTEAAIAFAPFLGVQANWLELAFTAAEKQYGSIDQYIAEGLNVSQETRQKLKAKLTSK